MAGRFEDGFERYKAGSSFDSQVAGGVSARWTSVAFGTFNIGTAYGRNGQGIALGAGINMFKTLTHETGWTVGFAYQVNAGTSGNLFANMYQGMNNGTQLIGLRVNVDGSVTVYTPTNIALNSIVVVQYNKFHYYELKYDISGGSNCTVTGQLWIDGQSQGTFSAVATGVNDADLIDESGTTNMHQFSASFSSNYMDDLYILDHNGSLNNDHLGDVELVAIWPNGDASPLDFTPSVGTTHYNLINFTPPTGDASSVFDNTVNDIDLYQWQDIPTFTGTIPFVCVSFYVRKDAEGSRSFKIKTTNTLGAEQFISDDYIYYDQIWDEDPDSSVAWTVTNFNAMDFGVKIIS